MPFSSDRMTSTKRSAALAILAAATLSSACLSAHAKDNVEGMLHVECWMDGKVQLTMDRDKKTNHWTETNQNGAVDKNWRTAQRDNNSFYLTKPGVKLQLDMYLKKCTWDSGGKPVVYNVRNEK